MTGSSTDRIHKEITLRAPVARVWKALTDSTEFGQWFGVSLDGPFRVGEKVEGQITHKGYEHLRFQAVVESMEPERRFALRWDPKDVETEAGLGDHVSTLVEFLLEGDENGTKLSVSESGFDQLPEKDRVACFKRNEQGWSVQVENIRRHVDG